MTGIIVKNLVGWRKVATWGYECDIWANGRNRTAIDRNTGEIIASYTVDDGKERGTCPGTSQCLVVAALTSTDPGRFNTSSTVIEKICLKCSLSRG